MDNDLMVLFLEYCAVTILIIHDEYILEDLFLDK